jgi:phosphatidylserine synthase/dienelactone hydrolase
MIASTSASPLGAFHRSNALTYVSLLAGIGAIATAARGGRAAACALIAIAVVADTFDGRFARLFRRSAAQAQLGAQLDSLSDAIAFGIAPAVCMGALALAEARPADAMLFWIATAAFAACAITRLAFFNVMQSRPPDAAASHVDVDVDGEGFVGLPTPVAALSLATTVAFEPNVSTCAILLGVTAIAMVLPLRIPRPRGLALAAFVAWPLLLVALTAGAGTGPEPLPYDTLFYTHGGLKLEAYLYKPAGNGPFPLVIYNHGSRAGRVEAPMPFIGRLLTDAGYAVLVPERRGYGKSDGKPFSEDIGEDRGPRYIARLQAEAEDALAALQMTSEQHLPIDPKRVAIMGFSFGGSVTTLAVGRSHDFVAAVTQAPGALNWDHVPALQDTLIAAAGKSSIPMLCMAAKNDATTENVTRICGAAKAHGADTAVIIYPPFTPATPAQVAAGHMIFTQEGVDIWRQDTLSFLAKYLR